MKVKVSTALGNHHVTLFLGTLGRSRVNGIQKGSACSAAPPVGRRRVAGSQQGGTSINQETAAVSHARPAA